MIAMHHLVKKRLGDSVPSLFRYRKGSAPLEELKAMLEPRLESRNVNCTNIVELNYRVAIEYPVMIFSGSVGNGMRSSDSSSAPILNQ